VRFGLFLPPFGGLAEPSALMTVAAAAERAGWDGVFLWDHVMYRSPADAAADPWIALAAIATATRTVRLGAMVTPLARRRPQIVARQAVTLDRLSGGRLVLGAGLGLDRSGRELSAFGEEADDRRRAAMLDEALGLVTALCSGERVVHRGPHYLADDVRFLPTPVQSPRIPVWIAGRYPNRPPTRRAARWDGMFAIDLDDPAQLTDLAVRLAAMRGGLEGFDLVVMRPPGEDPAPWAAAGATWWLTDVDPFTVTAEGARALAEAGPPR
jgi:alkanesulfonate monooxygenase SsuD/methylene tetrahydromethanopterin reductase-like flavin-dependent oxidoreductase (luciferase family)